MPKKKKEEITIRSSAAEYLTYVSSVGDSKDSFVLQDMDKAQTEYRQYKAKTLSSVEKDYLENIKLLEEKGKQ